MSAISSRALVSIVVPCFNGASTLSETIQSALNQTWRNLEVIVVDDGSTDESALVIKKFGDRICAEFGPNRGASAARNRGTSLGRGAFVQYLDADDVLTPEAIERRVEALEKSGADVAYSDWQTFDTDQPDLKSVFARSIEEVDEDNEIACATSFWAPPVALLYRRSIVDKIGIWNENLPIIQDARFLFDAARCGARFVRVPGVSALYRRSAGTLSRRDESKFTLDIYHNGCDIQAMWESDGPLSPARQKALAGIFDYAARGLFHCDAPEFEDAVARLKRLSRRRAGYPELASSMSQILGPARTRLVLDGVSRLMRPIRSLIQSS